MKDLSFLKKRTSKQQIWRIVIASAAILLGLCFVTPLFLKGILNIGNMTGMVLCFAALLYAAFMKQINDRILLEMQNRPGRLLINSLAAVCAIIAFVAILITVLMVSAALRVPSGEETLVVLGCKAYGDRPSIMLESRLDAAYAYLKENPGVKCILSGGQGEDETMTEAECMYRWLAAKGISENRLYKEEFSTSTRENVLFSKSVAKENGLNEELTVVTNEYHCYRSYLAAKKQGIKCRCIPAGTPLWLLPTYYLRELYGVLYEWWL
ncbi:MAG: YdcF family protein [Lachnospiraceae bacterium]|nr:YdcF family protein [Lachnospiraceae bacterium]